MDFKNKNLLIGVGALIIIVVIGGYFLMKSGTKKDNIQPPIVSQSQPTPIAREINGTLNAQNNSGEVGIVKLTEANDKITVDIALTGGALAIAQPAHIHKGTCATLDPKPLYPLANVLNGKSQTTIDNKTIADLKNEGPLAVNLHKSAQQASVYVACADLDPSQDTTNSNTSSPKTDNKMMQTPSTRTNSGY